VIVVLLVGKAKDRDVVDEAEERPIVQNLNRIVLDGTNANTVDEALSILR
jgi:hypothetical protein